jgi:hypothetical protein
VYGFASWQKLFNLAANDTLRSTRSNPNLLVPGDIVDVTPVAKVETRPTDALHIFKIVRPTAELRIYVRDALGHALANAKFTVEIETQNLSGQTDGAGLLKQAIPLSAMSATLTVTLPNPPASRQSPADGLVLPKETFTLPSDPKPADWSKPLPKVLRWTLSLGSLRPVSETIGLQNRLHNLGYAMAISGTMDAETTDAIHAFEADCGLPIGPVDAAVRAKLLSVHDEGSK